MITAEGFASVETEIENFVAGFRGAGLSVSDAEIQNDCDWNFDCELQNIAMSCCIFLHFVRDVKGPWWAICFSPRLGLLNSLFGHYYKDEQDQFVKLLTSLLRSDSRVSDLRWYNQDEWYRGPYVGKFADEHAN